MSFAPLLPLDYRPKLPIRLDYGIGVIGAGQIVNQAHLPAYRNAGLRVVAIADTNRSAAEETARRFEIPRVCRSADELLALKEVLIADIAVPARHNPELCEQAFQAGKHVLAQKPMAESLAEAERVVEAAAQAKRKLAINHQMRWAPAVRAASDLVRRGLLGALTECSIQIQIRTAWESWPWLKDHPFPEIYYHSIHHIDTMRSWLRDPLTVYAMLARHPQSFCAGPTRNYMLFEYGGDLRACILVNHHTMAPTDDFTAKFTIEGTEGRCEGLIGLLLNYPVGRSDLLTFSQRELTPNGSIRLELDGRWFPDAFLGPMSSLIDAIATDGEPETSGQEILGTMRLVEAICRSDEMKQTVRL